MKTFGYDTQPKLRFLSDEDIRRVHESAIRVLEEAGILFESDIAFPYLKKVGCRVDEANHLVYFSREIIENAIKSVPESFELYDRDGNYSYTIGGDANYFDPGSSGLNFLDSDGCTVRLANTEDMVNIYRLTDALAHIKLQSTAVSVADAPESIMDVYRMWLLIKNSAKPFISGALDADGSRRIIDLLTALRGDASELSERPIGIMDVCSQPPLKWGEVSIKNIIDFAQAGVPIETISVPMPGAASPATLAGSLIVHLAESLSGFVLAQAVTPGAKMVLGGAPMTFDMRYSTTSLNAPESNIIAASYAQMGRYYRVPTHCYACLADPKLLDAQAGLESAMSACMAAFGGTNIISGAGMIDFVNTFSLEKLLIDNEIVAMTERLTRGMDTSEEALATDLIIELGSSGDYLKTKHTLKNYRKETYVPPSVIDKKSRATWELEGEGLLQDRASAQVHRLLDAYESTLDKDMEAHIDHAIKDIMAGLGISSLPIMPS